MRRPRRLDFTCPNCKSEHTRFCETHDDNTPLTSEVCLVAIDDTGELLCNGTLVQNEMAVFQGYIAPIRKGNSDFNERERERLEKRQGEHWVRAGKDEAVDRERAMYKKHGMEGAGGFK